MKCIAIILAAGQGRRMNLPVAKQFLNILGKPMIYYSLKAFVNSKVDEIILVTGKEQIKYCWDIINSNNITKVSKVIAGGNERYDSVYNALNSIETADYVLVHDGARPFITPEIIDTVIDTVVEYKACIIGTPVKDTIKIVDQNGFIAETPDRKTMWAAQTPQAFDYSLIKKAYDLYYADTVDRPGVTDDAMVYEKYIKSNVKILTGDYNNIKVTTPEDLAWAEQMARQYFY